MLDFLQDDMIIITNNTIKLEILKMLYKEKKMLNLKFLSIKDFKDGYFGKVSDDALLYLVRNYKLNVDVAKEYLDNIFFDYAPLKDIYDDLLNKGYLLFDKLFQEEIKSKKIGVILRNGIDNYLVDTLRGLGAFFYEEEVKKIKKLKVYEYCDLEEEIISVASNIRDNYMECLSDVYLVNVSQDYYQELKRIFKFYNIPLRLNERREIFSTKVIQDFLNDLRITKSVEVALSKLKKGECYDKLVDLLNTYDCSLIDNAFIEVLTSDLRQLNIRENTGDNEVRLIDFDDIVDNDKYYFVMNFNQGVVPKVFHDDCLIKDVYRKDLGLLTSFERLKNEKEKIKFILNNFDNIRISYKLKDYFTVFSPSVLVNEFDMEVVKDEGIKYSYSNDFNKLMLARYLDDYINFNVKNDKLNDLFRTYSDIFYKYYDNSFDGVDFNLLKEYLGNKLVLSYSSINNYFHCAFRYYIENILHLDSFESSFATLIGNLFHYCLAKSYEDDFNLRLCYDGYLKDKVLSDKESFFVDKLYKNLEFIVDTIKYQDSRSSLKNTLCEKEISIDINDNDLDIKFIGFVDKIKCLENDSDSFGIIIDYKSGSILASLDNVNYGFNLQLPVYVYLINNGLNKDMKILGFYLQKLLLPKKIDIDDIKGDLKNNLKLIGYTIDEENFIELVDDSYVNSEVIHSMKKGNNGFYQYTKLISDRDILKLSDIVNERINEVICKVKQGDFEINPKRFNNDLVGCEFCKFKDICFRKEENIKDLSYVSFKNLIGGE